MPATLSANNAYIAPAELHDLLGYKFAMYFKYSDIRNIGYRRKRNKRRFFYLPTKKKLKHLFTSDYSKLKALRLFSRRSPYMFFKANVKPEM